MSLRVSKMQNPKIGTRGIHTVVLSVFIMSTTGHWRKPMSPNLWWPVNGAHLTFIVFFTRVYCTDVGGHWSHVARQTWLGAGHLKRLLISYWHLVINLLSHFYFFGFAALPLCNVISCKSYFNREGVYPALSPNCYCGISQFLTT